MAKKKKQDIVVQFDDDFIFTTPYNIALEKKAAIALKSITPYQEGRLDKLVENLLQVNEYLASRYVSEYAPGLDSFCYHESLFMAFTWKETRIEHDTWEAIYDNLIWEKLETPHVKVHEFYKNYHI